MTRPATVRSITLRLPADMKTRLRVGAAHHDRSMNEHVVALLDEAFRLGLDDQPEEEEAS